jgi:hypothetical protein
LRWFDVRVKFGRWRVAAVVTAVALGIANGSAHAALPAPNCLNLTAMIGATTNVAPPVQQATDLVFTNQSSFLCQLDGFPKVVLRGPRGTTYRPVEAAVKAAAVEVQPGMSVHVRLTYLTGTDADTCDAGHTWVPSAVDVTPPVAGARPFELPWQGPKVDNCQGAATHPGTYVGPVEPGDGASTSPPTQPPLSHDVCVPYRQALSIAGHAAAWQGDVASGRAEELAWQQALQALDRQIGSRAGIGAALSRLGGDPAVGVPRRGAAARDRDLAAVAAATGTACARGLPRTAEQVAIAEGVAASGVPAPCADVVDVKQSRVAPEYASASTVVDSYLFGLACNYQGGNDLLRRDPHFGWSVIATGTERPCAVKGVPIAVLRGLYGSRCGP